jgi:hypothetical protein
MKSHFTIDGLWDNNKMDCYLRHNLRLPKKSCLPLKKRGSGELLSLNYF